MPASVWSSTKLCADSVTSATHASPRRAAVDTAMPPPTLWPKGISLSIRNAFRSVGTTCSASSRMNDAGSGPG